jgi:hypothetical protein
VEYHYQPGKEKAIAKAKAKEKVCLCKEREKECLWGYLITEVKAEVKAEVLAQAPAPAQKNIKRKAKKARVKVRVRRVKRVKAKKIENPANPVGIATVSMPLAAEETSECHVPMDMTETLSPVDANKPVKTAQFQIHLMDVVHSLVPLVVIVTANQNDAEKIHENLAVVVR